MTITNNNVLWHDTEKYITKPNKNEFKLENLLHPRRSRMMHSRPPNLTLASRGLLTLTFDLQTPEVDCFMPLPVDHLCQFASKSVHSFSKYHVHKGVNKTWPRCPTDIETSSLGNAQLCRVRSVWIIMFTSVMTASMKVAKCQDPAVAVGCAVRTAVSGTTC